MGLLLLSSGLPGLQFSAVPVWIWAGSIMDSAIRIKPEPVPAHVAPIMGEE